MQGVPLPVKKCGSLLAGSTHWGRVKVLPVSASAAHLQHTLLLLLGWQVGVCQSLPGIWKAAGLGFRRVQSSLSRISALVSTDRHCSGVGWKIISLLISCTLSLCCLMSKETSGQGSHFTWSLFSFIGEKLAFLEIKCSLTFSLPLLLIYFQEEIILPFRTEGYSLSYTLPVYAA